MFADAGLHLQSESDDGLDDWARGISVKGHARSADLFIMPALQDSDRVLIAPRNRRIVPAEDVRELATEKHRDRRQQQ